jgi:hypothetical protein
MFGEVGVGGGGGKKTIVDLMCCFQNIQSHKTSSKCGRKVMRHFGKV